MQFMELKINLIQDTPDKVCPDIWAPCGPVKWSGHINIKLTIAGL